MNNCAGIIIQNDEDKILLQLRDNKTKRFPNCWVILGGSSENKEEAIQTIKRELKEEIELDIDNFSYFGTFLYKNDLQNIFYKKMNLDIANIKLHEGEKIQFFTKKELDDIKMGFNSKEILQNFFERQEQNKRAKKS